MQYHSLYVFLINLKYVKNQDVLEISSGVFSLFHANVNMLLTVLGTIGVRNNCFKPLFHLGYLF